jgi:hypothetical protein
VKKNKKLFAIDADTLLVRSALACQEERVVVKHKGSDKKKIFKNRTAFWGGNFSKKDGGWLADLNAEREANGKPPFTPECFEIEPLVEITNEDFVAFGRFEASLERIIKHPLCKDYKIVIGGCGNFRDDIATIQKYKGNRIDKPLRFDAVKDFVKDAYKDKVVWEDGFEADDVVSVLGWWGYHKAVKAGNMDASPITICACDKDLYQVAGYHLNYLDKEIIPEWVGIDIAARRFWTQMLTGDATDNILGLHNFTDEIRKEFGIRKSKGVGPKGAEKYLEGCNTERDMYVAVSEAYKDYYGDNYTYTGWRGDEITRNWKEMMNENFILLRMLEKRGHITTLYEYEERF